MLSLPMYLDQPQALSIILQSRHSITIEEKPTHIYAPPPKKKCFSNLNATLCLKADNFLSSTHEAPHARNTALCCV